MQPLKRGLGSPNMDPKKRKRICSAGGSSHSKKHYREAGRLGAIAGHAKRREDAKELEHYRRMAEEWPGVFLPYPRHD